MCISGIYAFTNSTILSIENELNTGAVNIELNEYTISNGTETIYDETTAKSVLPGQVISLIPRISNLGDSSYIRAKISYTSDENITQEVADNNIDNIAEQWVKRGSYWYYKQPVSSGASVDLFKTIQIPSDISNDYQGEFLQLNITAEAVQSENFNPNFDSDSPWSGIEVQEATNYIYKTDKVQLSQTAKIEYENNAELYVNVPDNFLGKLGHLIPGDVVEQEITINNTTSDAVEYFVSFNKESNISEKQIELLKKLNLNISIGDEAIYQGNLYDLVKLSLGSYASKTTQKVKFKVSIPAELGNEYSDINTSINWVFSVTGKDPVIPEEPKPVEPPIIIGPQTGDTNIQIAFTAFFVSAIGLIIILFVERRNKKK